MRLLDICLSEFEGVGAGEECSQPSQIFELHIGGNASFFHSYSYGPREPQAKFIKASTRPSCQSILDNVKFKHLFPA